MDIHFLNCFTCSARVPSGWHSGTLCLLIETDQGLVLVDTGLGQDDYVHRTGIVRTFQVVTMVPMNPAEAAVRQVAHLGYKPQDVRHIVLTHMHFDHCGGLPDFPHASVHVHRREYEAFRRRPRRWTDLAYVRRHIAHQPEIVLYDDAGESWFHVGDAAPMGLAQDVPGWLVSLVLGPHAPRLRQFRAAHPAVRMTTGHMWLDFFVSTVGTRCAGKTG